MHEVLTFAVLRPAMWSLRQVFYLVNSNRRFASERANLSYGVVSFFLAETLVTALAQLLWVPGCTIAFFMVSEKMKHLAKVQLFTAGRRPVGWNSPSVHIYIFCLSGNGNDE